MIQDVQQMIQDRIKKIQDIKHSAEVREIYSSLCIPTNTRNWPEISMKTHRSLENLRKALTQIQETLHEKLTQTELTWMQQYAVDVTLDPDTAHPNLILSDDGKQVRHGDTERKLLDNPKRFNTCPAVLGKEGFSSGRFYFEVQVKKRTAWDLGVATEYIKRKGAITLDPSNGYWAVWLRNRNEYKAHSAPKVSLSLRVKPQRVGVFVDYEKGLVSFYDVESSSHIYSFTDSTYEDTERHTADDPRQNQEDSRHQTLSRSQKKLKWMRQYAVDVTLDPDTAHPCLILSKDGKQVRCGDIWQKLPDNPKRYDRYTNVLGTEGFSRKFYFEVQVKEKTRWELGVARGSVYRKGEIKLRPTNGYWTVWLKNGHEYAALSDPPVSLFVRVKPQRVGVFVDYEEGLVSFYDVESSSHIYSFTDENELVRVELSRPPYETHDPTHQIQGQMSLLNTRRSVTDNMLSSSVPTTEPASPACPDAQLMKTQMDVQQMIQDRIKKIQDIKHSAEVRKIYSSMCSPTNTGNWPEISVRTHENLKTVRRALTQLQDTLDEKLVQTVSTELKWMQQYAVKPQRVGVFVDYEEGLVSFYDVESSSHIYSYTGQVFYLSTKNSCVTNNERTHDTESLDGEPTQTRALILIRRRKRPITRAGLSTQLMKTQKDMQQMIQDRIKKIQDIKHSAEVRKIYSSLCSPTNTRNWPEISMKTHKSLEALRSALTQLQETLDEKLIQTVSTELKWMQQYAVDVTLDTAYPKLNLSDDGKQVRHGDIRQKVPDNPKRFDRYTNVLGVEGFSSGRFYFEVQVREKTRWELGVARESVTRKGNIILSPTNGYWTVWLKNGNEYAALSDPPVSLSLRVKPQRVGVFVDYEEGLVSFYDVESSSHIYSFTDVESEEKKTQMMKTQKDMQQMIQDRVKKIQDIKHSAEVRKIYSSLCSPKNTRIWPEINVRTYKNLETLRRALTQLRDTLDEKLNQRELKWMQQYAELKWKQQHAGMVWGMTELMIKDTQQMIQIKIIQDIKNLAEVRKIYSSLCSPTNTRNCPEISIKNHKNLEILRRALTQMKGILNKKLTQTVKLQRVCVFVDYEEGLVSFYDVESSSHIYSYTGQSFTDKLYPYFGPSLSYAELKWMQQYAELAVTKTQLMKDVWQMIQDRIEKIQDIKHSAEVRKIYSSLCSPINTRNWPEISIETHKSMTTLRRALIQLQDTLNEKLSHSATELKWMQQYAGTVCCLCYTRLHS
ncbi:E3 ubiquitin- ligase TRIM21-like isoform X1 [Labeo rohita]|uniref:E3 ubiquitin-ligase TRIM21-like isoform X1 n=1 Tax=Labeo rohita TaxID=84645 RepID=A0A498MGD8_LABRO|nr:E3 ubiquitin- ligase TRIM21-like isoform X1 [Labeo rohita]